MTITIKRRWMRVRKHSRYKLAMSLFKIKERLIPLWSEIHAIGSSVSLKKLSLEIESQENYSYILFLILKASILKV